MAELIRTEGDVRAATDLKVSVEPCCFFPTLFHNQNLKFLI